jgi:hypothetical protein
VIRKHSLAKGRDGDRDREEDDAEQTQRTPFDGLARQNQQSQLGILYAAAQLRCNEDAVLQRVQPRDRARPAERIYTTTCVSSVCV